MACAASRRASWKSAAETSARLRDPPAPTAPECRTHWRVHLTASLSGPGRPRYKRFHSELPFCALPSTRERSAVQSHRGASSSSSAMSAHSTSVSTTSFVARPSSRDSQYRTFRCAKKRPRTSRCHTATESSKSRLTASVTAAAKSGGGALISPNAFLATTGISATGARLLAGCGSGD